MTEMVIPPRGGPGAECMRNEIMAAWMGRRWRTVGVVAACLAAGANDIRSQAPVLYSGWHLLGTARMGTNPQRSVVNEWGRSHDVKNLFIVDGSIFVTSGGVNPTATIQALALFIAEQIKQRLANLFD